MKEYIYRTSGTCSQLIRVVGENGRLLSAEFQGGCHGNLQGIGALVKGMPYDEVISRLEGIRCGVKSTSCPDQLAKAVRCLKAAEA